MKVVITATLLAFLVPACESPTGPGTNSNSVNTDEIPAKYMNNDSLGIDTVPKPAKPEDQRSKIKDQTENSFV